MATAPNPGDIPSDEPTGPKGDSATYLTVDGFKAFWHAGQPDRVHLATSDPRFVDENGAKPGIRVVFSSNPLSADYNPANFNRVSRVLRAAGAPAPDEVPVGGRKLKDRPSAGKPAPPPGAMSPTDPGAYGWASCPTCHSVVVDLDGHNAAIHQV